MGYAGILPSRRSFRGGRMGKSNRGSVRLAPRIAAAFCASGATAQEACEAPEGAPAGRETGVLATITGPENRGAFAINADASVAVGRGTLGGPAQAAIWRDGAAPVSLDAERISTSLAKAVSDDGAFAVGWADGGNHGRDAVSCGIDPLGPSPSLAAWRAAPGTRRSSATQQGDRQPIASAARGAA